VILFLYINIPLSHIYIIIPSHSMVLYRIITLLDIVSYFRSIQFIFCVAIDGWPHFLQVLPLIFTPFPAFLLGQLHSHTGSPFVLVCCNKPHLHRQFYAFVYCLLSLPEFGFISKFVTNKTAWAK